MADTTSEILYVKSRPAPWLDMKNKWIYNAYGVFYAQIKFPSEKKQLFGGTAHKICMFRCAGAIPLWEWLTMDVEKSKIVEPEEQNFTCPRMP